MEKLYRYGNNKLFAKIEADNPSGSSKDRPVFYMLQQRQKKGFLKPGTVVIEATSGNTGIALAYFSSIFNYHAFIVMPKSMSLPRREMIKQAGGELVLVDGGMKECQEKALELHQKMANSFIFGQFEDMNNPQAHYLSTGREILRQCPEIDYLFAGIGTGGTISGSSRYLKENRPGIMICGVEPLQSPLLTQGVAHPHCIEGIGANFIPATLNLSLVDEIVDVDDQESLKVAKEIRKNEKLDIGISSGAAFLGAVQYLKEHQIVGKNVVIIFPDKGDRYSW